jgi:hypothetical protein
LSSFFKGLAWGLGVDQVRWVWVIFWHDWGSVDCFIFNCSDCCNWIGCGRFFFLTFCCGKRAWRALGRDDWEEFGIAVNKFYKYFSKIKNISVCNI